LQPVCIGDPAQAAGSDSGDAEGDAVALTQFSCAVVEQADQSPVDVAETEEAEVVSADFDFLEQGLKPTLPYAGRGAKAPPFHAAPSVCPGA